MADRPSGTGNGFAGGANNSGDDDIDTGHSVSELAELAQPPGRGFLGGIRRAIQRRQLVSQAAELSWNAPMMVLVEYLKMIFGLLKPPDVRGR